MGIVVSKRPYKSIPTDTPDKYSSINMNDYSYNDGMSLVHKNGVHRQHFSRVLTSAPARRIVATGDAQQVPTWIFLKSKHSQLFNALSPVYLSLKLAEIHSFKVRYN